jgi:hypothetical protein
LASDSFQKMSDSFSNFSMLKNIVDRPSQEEGVEIYGLNMSTNGRQCINHSCCGEHITQGSLLKLFHCTVTIKEKEEPAIKAMSLSEGSYGCTVGFLPRF